MSWLSRDGDRSSARSDPFDLDGDIAVPWASVESADKCWRQAAAGPLSALMRAAKPGVDELRAMITFLQLITLQERKYKHMWDQLKLVDSTEEDRWLFQAHLYMLSMVVADPEEFGAFEFFEYLTNSGQWTIWMRTLIPVWIHQHAHARLSSLEANVGPAAEDPKMKLTVADQAEWQKMMTRIGKQCGYDRYSSWHDVRDFLHTSLASSSSSISSSVPVDPRRVLFSETPAHWLQTHITNRLPPLRAKLNWLQTKLDAAIREQEIAARAVHVEREAVLASERQALLLDHQTKSMQELQDQMKTFLANQDKERSVFLRGIEADKLAFLQSIETKKEVFLISIEQRKEQFDRDKATQQTKQRLRQTNAACAGPSQDGAQSGP